MGSLWSFRLIYLIVATQFICFTSSLTTPPPSELRNIEKSPRANKTSPFVIFEMRKAERLSRTNSVDKGNISVRSSTTLSISKNKTDEKSLVGVDKTSITESIVRKSGELLISKSDSQKESVSVSFRREASPAETKPDAKFLDLGGTTTTTTERFMTPMSAETPETEADGAVISQPMNRSGRNFDGGVKIDLGATDISRMQSPLEDKFDEDVSEEPDDDFEEDPELIAYLTETCKGRCGEGDAYPCSCAPVCLLYDTCCENMTLDCPDVVAQAREDLHAFFGADLHCGTEEVYMIASCPNGGEIRDNVTEEGLAKTELERGILSAPVTDGNTGITFLNSSYYQCHEVNPEKPRQLLKWGMRLDYREISPLTLGDFPYPKGMIVPYGPMFDWDILKYHRCYRDNLVTSCEGAIYTEPVPAYVAKSDAEKCLAFTAYVYDDSSLREGIYRNRYCGFCHVGRIFGLNLISTFSSDYGEMLTGTYLLATSEDSGAYLLRVENLRQIDKKPWLEAKCPSTVTGVSGKLFEQRAQDICENVCGNRYYTVKPDGRCKMKLHTSIALSDNYLALEPLQCKSALERIADFLACGISQIDREPWKYSDVTESTVTVAFDRRTKRRLYVIQIFFDTASLYTGREIMAVKAEDVKYNIYKTVMAIKAYQKYRIDNEMCENPDPQMQRGEKALEANIEIDSVVLRKLITNGNNAFDLNTAMLEYRGAVVDSENVSTICVSDLILDEGEIPQLACMQDKVHEHDEEEIDKLLNSNCADLLHRKTAKSHGCKEDTQNLMPKYILILGLALIYKSLNEIM